MIVGLAPASFATRVDLSKSFKSEGMYSAATGCRHASSWWRASRALSRPAAGVIPRCDGAATHLEGIDRLESVGPRDRGHRAGAGAIRPRSSRHVPSPRAREARGLPGVEAAASGNSMPLHLDRSGRRPTRCRCRSRRAAKAPRAIRPRRQYFPTLQIPLRYGRDFNDFDTTSSPAVAMINGRWRKGFRGANAVGRQLRGPRRQAGGDRRHRRRRQVQALGEARLGGLPAGVAALLDVLDVDRAQLSWIRRARGGLRQLLHRIDPNLPIRSAATGDEITAFPLLPYRVAVAALGLLGLICSGLLLSGLHAMVAYTVARRQREMEFASRSAPPTPAS